MNQHFLEKNQVALGVIPRDFHGAANNGNWVSMKNYGRLAIVLVMAAGTAGQDPTIVVQQATDVTNSLGDAKALNFDRIDVKQGAALNAIGQFTQLSNSDNDYTELTAAENQKIWVIDIKAEDLDIDNNFDCVRATVADVGANAQIGTLLYFLHEPRFATVPLPSAIAN